MYRLRVNSTPQKMVELIITFLAVFGLSTSFAAGFDCAKSHGIEKRICADYQLSSLDEELNIVYKLTLVSDEKRAEQVTGQRQWIAETRDACPDKACLLQVYRQRIAFLQEKIMNSPSKCGLSAAEIEGPWRGLNESQFEELDISVENGQRLFSSWRHSRPEYDGTWDMQECKLRLADAASSALVFDYVVVGLVGNVLYLKDPVRGEGSLYLKLGN